MAEIRIESDTDGVTADALRGGFFEGWLAPLSPEEHLRLLAASPHVSLAWDRSTVVGFATAITDGVLCAYIPLLEVLPAYRGNRTGTRLIERLLEDLRHLYMVDVMCDDDVFPFYERLGFARAGGGIIRNYGWR
ncbi:MAG TPA: GNAT family N-acetyltransferase [Acidimicrobiales bacterium]|jgi:GNAT superfamily N-acetyltransferase|nr:GNAT family N-acetyltransferase [Acidimicrobiales bacterium]